MVCDTYEPENEIPKGYQRKNLAFKLHDRGRFRSEGSLILFMPNYPYGCVSDTITSINPIAKDISKTPITRDAIEDDQKNNEIRCHSTAQSFKVKKQ